MVGKTGSELERIWSKFMELERRINELEAKQPTAPKQSEEARELFAQAEFPAKPTPNPQEKKYIGSIGGVPIISDPKTTEPHFRAPLTSDPQETVANCKNCGCPENEHMPTADRICQHFHWQECRGFERIPETLPNTQSPELAEPHVVQVPQESSPGFEDAARQILFRVHSSQPLGLDYKDAVKAILAVHNDVLQEAKREGLRAFIEFDAGPRCKEKDNDCYCCKMWEHYDEYLRVLEEETT